MVCIKLEKYHTNKKFDEKAYYYTISYDYQAEEIIWNKQDRALNDSKMRIVQFQILSEN